MKRKRRSNIPAIALLLALIIYATVTLVSMYEKISAVSEEKDALEQQVVELETENSELEYAIENSDDKKVIEDIARADLGLIYPGEKVFIGD